MEAFVNYHSMMKEYKEIDLESKLVGNNKHNFIKLVLEDVLKNLKSLSYCIQQEKPDLKVKSRTFSQILSGIMILQTSLDFEKGEPIDSNLFNLYDYCRKAIIKDYKNNEFHNINQCIDILEEINGAWSQIG